MKKIYFTLLTFLPFITSAQTLTQADLPVAGMAFTIGTDSAYTAAVPPGGMNQTWDFTGLQNLLTDTVGFISSAGTPYAASFSGSNLAGYDQETGTYSYFTSNPNGFYFDGFASSSGTFVYNPSSLFSPVPFSFGSNLNSVSRITIDTVISDSTGTYNLRIIDRVESTFEGDGTGTLLLPNAVTYNNVLRMKITNLVYDTVLVDITGLGFYTYLTSFVSQTTTFRYLVPGNTYSYVLGVDADSLGTYSTYSEYMINSLPLSVNESPLNKPSVVYPNPSSGQINFTFDNLLTDAVIVVFDLHGRQLIRRNASDPSNTKLDTQLAPGSYLYEIQSSKGVSKGNFVISR
jgi:hypothetical protein